jgi:hypothetical protein
VRRKPWAGGNSRKVSNHGNVRRRETTINEPKGFPVDRTAENDPDGARRWRALRRRVADLYRRAQVSQAANERYLGALAGVAEPRTVKALAEPRCRRVPAPGRQPARKVRALKPLAAAGAALLTAVRDPRWMVNGLRNRDLVQALYPEAPRDAAEKRRRAARVTRFLRLLPGHGLIQKVPRTHRDQVRAEARTKILALLAAGNASPAALTAAAA